MLVNSTAKLRYLSIPPRKMRLVADSVKGLPVEKALGILNFTPRIAARHLAKTVKSAAANALSQEGTDHLRPEALVVKNIIVEKAPTAKRIRFRSMGRVFRVYKRFCHLTVMVEGKTDVEAELKAAGKIKKAKAKADSTDAAKETKAKAKTKVQAESKAKAEKTEAKAAKVETKAEDTKTTPDTAADNKEE